MSRKRGATNKTEASILKETQISALSPVPEAGVSHNSSRDISNVGVTPVQKKKRKLYKQTPQLSEVSAVCNIIVSIYSVLFYRYLRPQLIGKMTLLEKLLRNN